MSRQQSSDLQMMSLVELAGRRPSYWTSAVGPALISLQLRLVV